MLSGDLGAADALSDDGVTLAAHPGQALGIENGDLSPADLDQASFPTSPISTVPPSEFMEIMDTSALLRK